MECTSLETTPKDPSYYLVILIHLPALFLNPNRTGSNIQHNKTRSNFQIQQNCHSQTNLLRWEAGRKERKKGLYTYENDMKLIPYRTIKVRNHPSSLSFSFFWRCTARTPFDSSRTVYIRVTTQIPSDEGFGTYTTHAVTTSLIIPSARVTSSVCRGVAYSALSNGFGAAQTSRHVSVFVLLVLRLAMILVERI